MIDSLFQEVQERKFNIWITRKRDNKMIIKPHKFTLRWPVKAVNRLIYISYNIIKIYQESSLNLFNKLVELSYADVNVVRRNGTSRPYLMKHVDTFTYDEVNSMDAQNLIQIHRRTNIHILCQDEIEEPAFIPETCYNLGIDIYQWRDAHGTLTIISNIL